jgi:DNA-binding CsgD family transcriptional regulator
MNVRRRPDEEELELPAPEGMSASFVDVDGEEFLVLALPIPRWTLPASFTEAERSIAHAVLQGATNEQIARERKSSTRTVGNQIVRIFAKLAVTSRIELAHKLASTGNMREGRHDMAVEAPGGQEKVSKRSTAT